MLQVNRFVSVSALKHYFNVTNSYVVNKLFLVLFPWRHKPWSRKQTVSPGGQEGWYLPPRDDINSPDMYIPVMSLVTYIFLQTLIAGLRGQFQPELFGYIATTALVVVIVEILGLKLGCYLLSISNESQLLDLVAYSGYKFVGVIVTISIAEIVNGGKGTGGVIGWTVFAYTFFANALFLVCRPAVVSRTGLFTDLRSLDAFLEIRPSSREQQQRSGSYANHAYRGSGKKVAKTPVPLLLRLYRAALFHVDSEPAVKLTLGGLIGV